jgi:hypothetical protein
MRILSCQALQSINAMPKRMGKRLRWKYLFLFVSWRSGHFSFNASTLPGVTAAWHFAIFEVSG